MNYLSRSSAADDRIAHNYEKIFGNDSGEDEDPEILAKYFVELQSFRNAYDKNRRLEIVKARKGMGKSALLSHLQYRLESTIDPLDAGSIAIRVTGNDLMGLADFSGSDSSLMENRWKQVICKRITMEIGKEISFAISDDSMTVIEAAEIEGFKGRNLVTCLTRRLGKIIDVAAKAATGGAASLDIVNPTEPKALAYQNILTRVRQNSTRNVWILIDDIDAKFVDTSEQQCRIGSFFSAIRALAFSVDGLRIRASVRTDVWTNLRLMEDQDKLRQYVSEIKWSDETLKVIFSKRILSYLQIFDEKNYGDWNEVDDYDRIVAQVFQGNFKIGSEKRSDPLSGVIAMAGKRPRWMGQLCKLAGAAAGNTLIQSRHFDYVLASFGKEKISDLIKEHKHQFVELEKLIDAFRETEKSNTRFKLLSIIDRGFVNKIGIDKIPLVNGFPFHTTDQIAKLLFEIDFLVGEKSGHHVPYHEQPTLFESEANSQNKITWVLNLSYRRFLDVLN